MAKGTEVIVCAEVSVFTQALVVGVGTAGFWEARIVSAGIPIITVGVCEARTQTGNTGVIPCTDVPVCAWGIIGKGLENAGPIIKGAVIRGAVIAVVTAHQIR